MNGTLVVRVLQTAEVRIRTELHPLALPAIVRLLSLDRPSIDLSISRVDLLAEDDLCTRTIWLV